MPTNTRDHSRRQFLNFLAGSPLLYGLSGTLLAGAAAAQTRSETDAVLRGALEFKDIIESVDQALNVWDFEPAMRARVNAGHYAYMAQGADDFGTIAANRAGFEKIKLRPQRLVDVSKIDMSTEIFGQKVASPLYLCPVGAQMMFHPDGEVAVARGAKSKNVVQALSTVTNYSVEDVRAARGAPGWYQLYSTSDWPSTLKQIKRAEAAGCTALAWTVDIPARNLEPIARFNRGKDPVCQACHGGVEDGGWSQRPMFDGIDMSSVRMGLNGLYVDDEAGAAGGTGVGEEIIRIGGSLLIVESMRAGKSPQEACELAVGRVNTAAVRRGVHVARVAFLALDPKGRVGAAATFGTGFRYAVGRKGKTELLKAKEIAIA